MTAIPPQRQRWIVQPLLEAGLGHDELQALLFRLAFQAITDPAPSSAADLAALTCDQPAHVQAAWLNLLDRMLSLQLDDAPGP